MLKERFQNQLDEEFTNEDWLDCLDLGSLKTRFEICKDKDGEFRYIRAIQGHAGGVAPASSKSSSGGSGGSSNPTSIHPKAKFINMKKEISKEDRIWTFIPACQKCKRDSFETRISKCVTNVLRYHDQDEREADGAMHWNAFPPALKRRFQNPLEKEFTDEDGLHCLHLGSFKTRFEICKDDNGELRYIRAIQGHSGY